MPKLACRCGFVHNLSPIPDDGWVTIPDTEFESVLATGPEVSVDAYGALYECPKCGRIMWEKPGAKGFVIYQKKP